MVNVVILVLESVCYTLALFVAKREGSINKYLIVFLLYSILLLFLGSSLLGYLCLSIFVLLSLKYFLKIKTSLFDLIFMTLILFGKIVIEGTSVLLFYELLGLSRIITTLIFESIKIGGIILVRHKIIFLYDYLKIKWDRNDFNVRYISSVTLIVYTIISIIVLILK